MKSICVIPARGGSKRIPRKNIKLFHGKPIIAWSIECAIESALFEDVYVSTDDNEIAEIASKYGAKIPFLRPQSLSDDFANDTDVREHFINWMKCQGIEANFLCYLYPTAPFITIDILRGCLNLLVTSQARQAMTVSKFSYPVLRALKKTDNNSLSFMWDEYSDKRSQDLPELFHDAGQCYFFNLESNISNEERVGYEIPRFRSQDIDNIDDFEYAEILFSLLFDNK